MATTNMGDIHDRLRGVLVGLAAGDRIGGPINMAVRVAESLLDRREFDAADIAARYLSWWREGAFDTGPTAASVFELVASGDSFEEAAKNVHLESGGITAGCNPAHRATPLAMSVAVNDGALAEAAAREAALTHHHPMAGDVSASACVLCRQLILGAEWHDALQAALKVGGDEVTAAVGNREASSLSTGGFAPDVLAAAVYFVGTSHSFEHAMEAALLFAGPANYCPVLVGSIGGARWGASRIADSMVRHCDLMPRVREAAWELAAGWDE